MNKIYCKRCGKFLGKEYKNGLKDFEGVWKLGQKPVCFEYPNCLDMKVNIVDFKRTKWNTYTQQQNLSIYHSLT